jgi:NAD(P)-dependent dehydrogenase (short-subunit alcohol dehydrogenase family)
MAEDLFSVAGKRVFITGGGAGIGRMITEGLAERGARIFTVSRKKQVLDELLEQLKGKRGLDVAAETANLADDADLQRAVSAVSAHFDGAIDVLVNNSGATWGAPLDTFPMDGWDKVFDINVRALFLLSQQCLPLLRQSARPDDPARIINIGSISGIHYPMDNAWAYHPAKAAVHHLTGTMAKALAGENITVNSIAPGLFPSRMTNYLMPGGDDSLAASGIPLKRLGRPSDIVGTVLYLAGRSGAFTTGAIIKVDGGSAL